MDLLLCIERVEIKLQKYVFNVSKQNFYISGYRSIKIVMKKDVNGLSRVNIINTFKSILNIITLGFESFLVVSRI